MKRIFAALLCIAMLMLVCSCSNDDTVNPASSDETVVADSNATDSNTESSSDTTVPGQGAIINSNRSESEDCFPYEINALEYTLYTNIFYNDMGGDYVGTKETKTGTFAVIYDRFNEVTRYYVWGYYDETKCCDWQWEFVPTSTDNLPVPGSLVEVTGTFEADEAALDGYWYQNAECTVKEAYEGTGAEVDMTVMSGTLERVQIINMQNFADWFAGKKVAAYGRVGGATYIVHPYYDGAFEQAVDGGTMPAVDTYVIVSGEYTADAAITNATIAETGNY